MTGALAAGTGMPRARADAAVVVLDGEAVIHRNGQVHVLDPVATLVWRCCDGTATVPEIVAELAGVFATSTDTVGRDVGVAIDRLAALDLLVDSGADLRGAPEATGDALELLADPPGSCASCADRTWAHRSSFRVGSRLVTVGTDQAYADAAISGALVEHRIDARRGPGRRASVLRGRAPPPSTRRWSPAARPAPSWRHRRRPEPAAGSDPARRSLAQLASYGDLRAVGACGR